MTPSPPEGWQWDETLYLGSAPYYVRGRPPYAPDLADTVRRILSLDGRGRLLDVGCGPGVVTLPLAHCFSEVVGLDPDPGMLEEGARRAADAGVGNITWVRAFRQHPRVGIEPDRFHEEMSQWQRHDAWPTSHIKQLSLPVE